MTFSFANDRAASVAATRRAVDAALASTGYSCKTVSWDDVSRGTASGSLSTGGPNITDTRLKARDGTELFTVRSDNWNERLGVVRADDIALLIGNCEYSGTLTNITLQQFLQNPARLGAGYTGMRPHVRLTDPGSPEMVSIRFQTVFLPVMPDGRGRGSMQFAVEAYNYATRSDSDPQNLVLLATTQGLSVQADGVGSKRLLLHAGRPTFVSEYWLEAENSQHSVGGEQRESAAEREDALRRGKATSEIIGIKAMGTRFNVLMTIQVPLVQQRSSLFATHSGSGFTAFGSQATGFGSPAMGFGGGFSSNIFGAGGAGVATFGSKHTKDLFGSPTSGSLSAGLFGGSSGFGSAGANAGVGAFGGQSSAPFGSSFGASASAAPVAPGSSAVGVNSSPNGEQLGSSSSGACPPTFGGSAKPAKGTTATIGQSTSPQSAAPAQTAALDSGSGSGIGSGGANVTPTIEPHHGAIFGAPPLSVTFQQSGGSVVATNTATAVNNTDPTSVFGPAAIAARMRTQGQFESATQGRATAARVSRGDFYSTYGGLAVTEPQRNRAEHITVTCVLYNTVVGGIPNKADVLAAVKDMERLYAACTMSGRLADAAFKFMTPELGGFDAANANPTPWFTQHRVPHPVPPVFRPAAASRPFEPVSTSARDIVMNKCSQVESSPFLSANTVLELKLVTFGALQSDSVRAVLDAKFSELAFRVGAGDTVGAKSMLPELKLLIQGALNLQ